MCHFGIETFQGVFLSRKEIQCNIPYRPPTAERSALSDVFALSSESSRKYLIILPFTISLDGVRALSSLTYSYLDKIDIRSVSCLRGPLEGGGLLILTLSQKYDFDSRMSVTCLRSEERRVGKECSS